MSYARLNLALTQDCTILMMQLRSYSNITQYHSFPGLLPIFNMLLSRSRTDACLAQALATPEQAVC